MSSINFESASEKERLRNEMREIKEEILKKAKEKYEKRQEEDVAKKLRGDGTWMLPELDEKLSGNSKKEKEKHKNVKKKKKRKKKLKHKKRKKSDSRDSSGTEDEIPKKSRKKHHSSEDESSDSGTEDENEDSGWVEKTTGVEALSKQTVRDDWMTGGLILPTYAKEKKEGKRNEQNIDTYDPSQSVRELNPYWKDGGGGFPTFKKPQDTDLSRSSENRMSRPRGNWRKPLRECSPERERGHHHDDDKRRSETNVSTRVRKSSSESNKQEKPKETHLPKQKFLTDQELNKLGAELIKAEIIGDDETAKKLKGRLENAKKQRNEFKKTIVNNDREQSKSNKQDNKGNEDEEVHILLTTSDDRGVTRPLPRHGKPVDPYGVRKKGTKKVDTHMDGERMRFFADDDKYDLKQMFEREKYASGSSSDAQFVEMMGKQKSKKDDLDDIFADNIRKNKSENEESKKETEKAIHEHEEFMKILDSCEKCFDSSKMEKQLIVSIGSYVYLALPWHEGLQRHHCLIIPMQHVASSTHLDENVWNEVTAFRKALCRTFESRSEECVFFEIANNLHKKPHTVIHCIAGKDFEMLPFYFKKAILESEQEWSINKQLVTLKEKDLRQSIPKGLPYFWVNFGMDHGFAHVIEDQRAFLNNFAQEIIGGFLKLDPKYWRRPRREQNPVAKVKQFADLWREFDCTK